jgi:hypothetical protein
LEAALLSREEQEDLAGLDWNWSGAYTFQVADGVWVATSVSNPAAVLTADSADELRRLVRADYFTRRPAGASGVPATDYLQERMST